MTYSDFLAEMAYNQKFSLDKIETLTYPLLEHILKIWLMPDSQDIKHWESEVVNFIDAIDRMCNLKSKKRRPEYNTLLHRFQNLLEEKTIEKCLKRVTDNYKPTKKFTRTQTLEKIRTFLFFFWKSLAVECVDGKKTLGYIQKLGEQK